MKNLNAVATTANQKVETTLKGIKVLGITTPSTIIRIAKEQNLNTQEVYVRLAYSYEGNEYTASQKLQYIGESDYNKLLNMVGTEDTIDISLNVGKNSKGEASAFFYIYTEVEIADLFKEPVKKTIRAAAPDAILAKLGIK